MESYQLAFLFIDAFLLTIALILLIPVAVLFLECTASLLSPQNSTADAKSPRPKVAVLIPAYNEAAGIAATLSTIMPQLTPDDRLLVIADNCTDATAEIARNCGATAIERQDTQRKGKGYALDFGLQSIASDPPEVVIMVDADCICQPDAIEKLARVAVASKRPVQATYLMEQPPNPTPKDSISALAFLVKNLVRPSGLKELGFPSLLTGTGMAFPWSVIREVSLASSNIVEDMQMSLDLAIAGTPFLAGYYSKDLILAHAARILFLTHGLLPLGFLVGAVAEEERLSGFGGGFQGSLSGLDNVRFLSRLYDRPFEVDWTTKLIDVYNDLYLGPSRFTLGAASVICGVTLSVSTASLNWTVTVLLAIVWIGIWFVLQLFSGPTQIDANDNWQTHPNQATLQASGFAPSNAQESAILTTLAPGAAPSSFAPSSSDRRRDNARAIVIMLIAVVPKVVGVFETTDVPSTCRISTGAPVERWHPDHCGDSEMRIARDGTWFYNPLEARVSERTIELTRAQAPQLVLATAILDEE